MTSHGGGVGGVGGGGGGSGGGGGGEERLGGVGRGTWAETSFSEFLFELGELGGRKCLWWWWLLLLGLLVSRSEVEVGGLCDSKELGRGITRERREGGI